MQTQRTQQQQLELDFDGTAAFRPVLRRERRISRARWWFQQMHLAVDRALEWHPGAGQPSNPVQLVLISMPRGKVSLS